jgi:glycosyltransferase involved in cell wall biosynthesis
MTPLVSIIIPTYNYGHLISQTLDCLIAQSYPNIEIIIIDDGSVDNTKEIITGYQQNNAFINYFYQSNMGLSAARNAGIKKAKGDYIQLLDADDMISPNKIKVQLLQLLNKKTLQPSLVFSDSRFFKGNFDTSALFDKYKPGFLLQMSMEGEELIRKCVIHNVFTVSAPLIEKKVFDEVGLFNADFKSNEDWDFWLRCSIHGIPFIYDNDPLSETYIRVQEKSMMSHKKVMSGSEIFLRKNFRKLLPGLNISTALKKELSHINDTKIAFINIRVLNTFRGWNQLFKTFRLHHPAFMNDLLTGIKHTVLRVIK